MPETLRGLYYLDKFHYKDESLLGLLEALSATQKSDDTIEERRKRAITLRGALEVENKVAQVRERHMIARLGFNVRSSYGC